MKNVVTGNASSIQRRITIRSFNVNVASAANQKFSYFFMSFFKMRSISQNHDKHDINNIEPNDFR